MSTQLAGVSDPSKAIIRPGQGPLNKIFHPKSIAVIGATENPGSVGRTILWNLLSSPFGGTIYPVNPKRASVMGIKAYPSIKDVPEAVDLAVIVTPAPAVPGLIGQCVDMGIKGAIVISAGFKEMGAPGIELERQIMVQANRGQMRLIGPNCLGIMNPLIGLNATFAAGIAKPGNIAFLSQSGALCTAILDWSLRQQVGFSSFISLGSMLDISWGDLIDYLGNDPQTHAILMYMETIGDARSFLSAAREVALTKPIIVIKAGRTEAAAKAAASHTGSLAGSDDVLEAAFQRAGVLRVNTIADLFYMADVLSKQPRPKGKRLTILTNAGGPGVLATDALITGGGELAPVSEAAKEELNKFLPVHWSHANPVDILGDADSIRYAKSVEVISKDTESDGMLVILTPQDMTDPTQTAQKLAECAKQEGKPLLGSWMGGASAQAGIEILNRAKIPAFPYPDTACRAFNYMWRYADNLKSIYETPSMTEDEDASPARLSKAEAIIKIARDSGRTILTELESKQLMAAYGLPVVPTHLARTEADAVVWAEKIGFPVVLKLNSETITHKTDVGGVMLNLRDAAAVKAAFTKIQTSVGEKVGPQHFHGVTVQPMIKLEGYEVILGSHLDAQFGPVLLFGTGGQLVEVFKDRALGLPPLNTTLARRMMEQTKIYHALQGVRGRPPVDLAALEKILVRFSQLVLEQPWIKEIDINPLLASHENIVALDARVILHPPETDLNSIPRSAIRPYPIKYSSTWKLPDNSATVIRPIRPEDEPLLVSFHQTLSEESVHKRFFQSLKLSQRITHERLTRVCCNDYDREISLVVDRKDPVSGAHQILGVGRLSRQHGSQVGEFALIVSDPWQQKGIGTRLLELMVQIGRDEKLSEIQASILSENVEMQRMAEKLGFTLTPVTNSNLVSAKLKLAPKA